MDRVRSVMTLSNKHKAIYAEYSYLWMESRDTIQINLNRLFNSLTLQGDPEGLGLGLVDLILGAPWAGGPLL